MALIPVDEARARILKGVKPLPAEDVKLERALGRVLAKPLKANSFPPFNAVALLFWVTFVPIVGALMYLFRYKKPVVDDLVVNMVDVGEESGELDTMLYKVADTYDEEVAVLTESLTALMEPLLIVFLGGAVGFIVIALFLPLIKLINDLS